MPIETGPDARARGPRVEGVLGGEAHRHLVVIPTYQEAANIVPVVERTLLVDPSLDVLVVDDNSPDGTGDLADGIASRSDRVHVLHRTGKEGLGAAYLAGFAWGLERPYSTLAEMDADGSHLPEQLPRLYAALEPRAHSADLVIGSRWVRGGRVVNWPRRREALSRGGNAYVRRALRMPVCDATAGFRVFRADTLRSLDLQTVNSAGYCFQVDMTRRVVRAGLHVTEVPIDFHEREFGVSKMSGGIVREALWRVTVWAWQDRMRLHRAVTGDRAHVAPRSAARR